MLTYTEIKKQLGIGVGKVPSNGLAYLTHYLHNHLNGVSSHYQPSAAEYLKGIQKSLFAPTFGELSNLVPLQFDVSFPPPAQTEFTFIDLFAGIGGFRIPAQQLGGKCVFTSEFNFHAQKTYEANFGEIPFGDITALDINTVPDHDLLTAGFPCQPFSISGKMKGFEDTRGTLIYNVLQIIELRRPKVVLLENVKHLIHHDKGRTLKAILRHLEELGYLTSWKLLNASDFGVPQNRERIIIVAHHSKKFDFGSVKTLPKVILNDFLEKDVPFEFLDEPFTLLEEAKVQDSGLIFAGYRNKKIRNAGVRPGTENLSRVHKQPNRIYSTEGVHPALPSQESSGRFWILQQGTVRKLTINECYRIMGFPDDFRKSDNLGEAYRQIGNSVCVPMVKEILFEIQRQLL
jgi:DNA (cytosine-5)-methyltransferase 1